MPLSVCQYNYILSQSIYCVVEAYTTKLTNKCWICILFRNLSLFEGNYTLCAGRKQRHSFHCSEGMGIDLTTDAGKNETLIFASQTFAWETCSSLEVDAAFREHPLLFPQINAG